MKAITMVDPSYVFILGFWFGFVIALTGAFFVALAWSKFK